MFQYILMIVIAGAVGQVFSGGDIGDAVILGASCGVCFSLGRYSE